MQIHLFSETIDRQDTNTHPYHLIERQYTIRLWDRRVERLISGYEPEMRTAPSHVLTRYNLTSPTPIHKQRRRVSLDFFPLFFLD